MGFFHKAFAGLRGLGNVQYSAGMDQIDVDRPSRFVPTTPFVMVLPAAGTGLTAGALSRSTPYVFNAVQSLVLARPGGAGAQAQTNRTGPLINPASGADLTFN